MSFDSTVKKLQKKFFEETAVNAEGFENFGVEVHLTDEKNEGTFFIAVTDGQFRIEPFDYKGYACKIDLTATVLNSIANGKTTVAEAADKGKLTCDGNFDYALKVQELISKAVSAEAAKEEEKPAKKPAAKKEAAPKATAKKETAPKAEKHAAPKAAAKAEEKPAVKESPKAEVKEAPKAEVKAEVKEAPKADAKAPKAPHPRKAKRNK